ncbi:MAG: iron ABC transporter permease [Blautia sp.]|nr:iron ABC transporter permease [Blautia sp.]MDY3999964.1 iron ABC transporter permease [Blautia sp.]
MKKKKKSLIKWSVLWICFGAVAFVSLLLGRYMVAPGQVFDILVRAVTGNLCGEIEESVIINIRLPRILITLLIGAGMAASGTAFQGLFQNPLVSPDVLGVSSGAAFGAVLGIIVSGLGYFSMALAMICGVLSVAMTYILSKVKGQSTVLSLVLSGMIVQALMNALVSLLKYTADPYSKLPAITYWLMGSFSTASYNDLKLVGIPVAVSLLILFLLRWRINILSLGDEEAAALGVNPVRIRVLIIASSTVISACSVTIAGVIGWVGLVIPHITRMIFGVDHKDIIPASMLLGGIYLTVIDLIARSAMESEIPIGILTALIGAPVFAVLFKKTGGGS